MQGQNISCQTCQSPTCTGCSQHNFGNGGQMQMGQPQMPMGQPQMQMGQQQMGQPPMNFQTDEFGNPINQDNGQQSVPPTPIEPPTPPTESYVFVDMSAWDIIFWSIKSQPQFQEVQAPVMQ